MTTLHDSLHRSGAALGLASLLLLGACRANGALEVTSEVPGPALVEARSGAALQDGSMAGGEMSSGPASDDGAAKEKKAGKKAPGKGKKPTLEDLEKELATLQEDKVGARRKLRYAEAELEIAELGAQIARAESEESVRKARVALDAARQEMEVFDSVERPLAITKGKLRVKDSEHRLRSAETDLIGLEEIFAEEVEASAKPEILRRGRRDVERAKEQLEITKAEVALETDTKLEGRMRQLASSVRSAEASLETAERKAEQTRLRSDLDVEKATDGLDEQRRTSKKADGKVKAQQRKINAAKEAAAGQKGKGKKKARNDAGGK